MWYTLFFIDIFFILIFTGLEYAYLASNRLTIDLKKKQNTHNVVLAAGFFDKPEKFWSTTIIGLYISLIPYGFLLITILDPIIKNFLGAPLNNEYATLILSIFIGITVMLFTIGVLAKKFFENNPEDKLSFWAPFVNVIGVILSPFTKFATGLTSFTLKYLFNVRIKDTDEIFERVNTQEFLKHSLEGHIDDNSLNRELFDRALQFSQVKIRSCMVPRNEVLAMEVNTPIETLKQLFIDSRHSKIVIYEKNIDHIVGYVYHVSLNERPKSIKDVLMSIITVPETMNAIDLINKFTKEHKSIALVVDEFGGTAGVVSMENVLEEIFGNIQEEDHGLNLTENKINDKEYLFSGRLKIDYLNEKYHLGIKAKDAETLSGYIISRYESIPKRKNRIIIDRFEFDIEDVNDTRIETVKMKILQ